MRVLEVVGNQTLEPLLASSVPQLKSIGFAFVHGVANEEVYTDGGLLKKEGTL